MITFAADHETADANRGRREIAITLGDSRVRVARLAMMGSARALRDAGLLWEARVLLRAIAEVAANLRYVFETGRPNVMRQPLDAVLTKLRGRGTIDRQVFQIGLKAARYDGPPSGEINDLWELVGILVEPLESLNLEATKPPRSEAEARAVYRAHAPLMGCTSRKAVVV